LFRNRILARVSDAIASGAIATVAGLALPATAQAQSLETFGTNMYGNAGTLIEMPTAEVAPDAQLSTSISHFAGQTRTTLTFQVTPRLSASFRYSAVPSQVLAFGQRAPGNPAGYSGSTYYDRSFDISYQLLTENAWRPALSIGLRDFLGTGLYEGEYIVATKAFAQDRLRVTAGLGWGRLGSLDPIGSTGTRPNAILGTGGVPNYDRWFRGDVAVFGGVSYAVTDKLTFKAEYSSDAYTDETRVEADGRVFDRKSPWNFGVDYRVSDSLSFGAYYMYGSEIGANIRIAVNPRRQGVPGGAETAPVPVSVRPVASAADLGWTTEPSRTASAVQSTRESLDREGIALEAMKIEPRRATVHIRNRRFDIEAQSVGRTARILTRTLPASVETFVITQTIEGVPASSVVLNRRDLEQLENAPAGDILARAQFTDGYAESRGVQPLPDAYPRFSWSFGPYVRTSFFDPDEPLRADANVRLRGDYRPAPGWLASASITNRLFGNLRRTPRPARVVPVNPPPVVRTDSAFYNRTKEPRIETLTLAKFGRLGPDLYGRLTVGYLERMYAGVSGEVLWKPTDSPFALGVEANYVAKRDYDQLFGLRDYEVATGHVSAYYDFGNGFHGQLDVGRYLAGDWGATVSLDREFANGWRVGAYATKTDISSAAFGEGSFDKGIRITIPISWGLGTPDRRTGEFNVSSLTRDGGARLNVDHRLYEEIRETHRSDMVSSWGKFWR